MGISRSGRAPAALLGLLVLALPLDACTHGVVNPSQAANPKATSPTPADQRFLIDVRANPGQWVKEKAERTQLSMGHSICTQITEGHNFTQIERQGRASYGISSQAMETFMVTAVGDLCPKYFLALHQYENSGSAVH